MAPKGTSVLWLCGLALLVTPGTKTGPFANPQTKGVPPTTESTENNVESYFPREAANRFTDFYSSYLSFAGEPSLLAVAHDVKYPIVQTDLYGLPETEPPRGPFLPETQCEPGHCNHNLRPRCFRSAKRTGQDSENGNSF